MQAKSGSVPKYTSTNIPPHKRLTLGLLVSQLEATYQVPIWRGVARVAQERDVNLLTFVGGVYRGVSYDPFEVQRNILYEVINPEVVDGLIIVTTTVGNFVSQEEMRIFCAHYSPIPVVSAGMAVEGIPSVLVDNAPGMREAIEHLITVHGQRRIAFVKGPDGNPEAEVRYQTYCETLADYGIPFDADLVAPGDFVNSESALRLLLDERHVTFEALVTANDNMALSGLLALRARGLQVPRDLAIVGFDDMAQARLSMPPLTTVRQPVLELGVRAADMVCALMQGEDVPNVVALPTELVVRRSCGCWLAAVSEAAVSELGSGEGAPGVMAPQISEAEGVPVTGVIPATGGARLLDALQAELTEMGDSLDFWWLEQLVDVFVLVIATNISSEQFLITLDELLHQVVRAGLEVREWQRVLSALRRATLSLIPAHSETWLRLEDVLGQARVLVCNVTSQQMAAQVLRSERQMDVAREVGLALIAALNMPELVGLLKGQLARLHIPGCYVSLYDQVERPDTRSGSSVSFSSGTSTLILAHSEREGGALACGLQGRGTLRFPTKQLLPPVLRVQNTRYEMVVEALYFREVQLGTLLLEVGPRVGAIYEMLRGQVSTALQHIVLMQQVEQRARYLRVVTEVARLTNRVLNTDDLLEQVAELVREQLALDFVGLFLLADAEAEVPSATLCAATGFEGEQMLSNNYSVLADDVTVVGWCISHRQSRSVLRSGDDAHYFNNPQLPNMQSETVLPMMARGVLQGVMTLQSTHLRLISQEALRILQTMTGGLATTLENTQLLERSQRALSEMEATQRRYQQQVWSDYLATAPQTSYEVVRAGIAPLGEGVLPEVQQATTKRAVIVSNGATVATEGAEHTALVVPITLRDEVIGVLGIHDDDADRVWSPDDMALVEAVAERMAQAAETLRLLDATQRSAARERLTGSIAAQMRASLEVDTVLQTAVQAIGEALGLHDLTIELET